MREFVLWDGDTLTEIVKLSSGYYGDYIRKTSLSLLLNYALWVKDNPEASDFHFDEISVIYNFLSTTKIYQKDLDSYYVLVGQINQKVSNILDELDERIVKII